MNKNRRFYGYIFNLLLFALSVSWSGPAFAAPITEQEALDIAEYWYPAEVNFRYQHGKILKEEQRSQLLNESGIRAVRYLVSSRELADKVKTDQQVLAYVVEFYPKGFVVLSGDDIFSPILAHSLESDFTWQDDCSSFSTYYLNNTAYAMSVELNKESAKSTKTDVHGGWSNLRSLVVSQKSLSAEQKSFVGTSSLSDATSIAGESALSGGAAPLAFGDELIELLDTAKWDQNDRYNNDLVPPNFVWAGSGPAPVCGVTTPCFPDDIWAGCNATALAIIMRYHQWPYRAVGNPYTHADIKGDVWGSSTIDNSVTFNWANMPLDNINNIGPNADIADLMLRAGGLTDSNWEITGTAGSAQPALYMDHLRYKALYQAAAYHTDKTPESNCNHISTDVMDYFFCPTTRTRSDANNHCTAVGMNLVRIFSEKENDETIGPEITVLGWSRAWIGASDSAAEGVWRWSDNNDQFWQGGAGGSPVNDLYSNWNSGEPNNSGNEDCGEIKSTYFWNDRSCTSKSPYICEAHLDANNLIPIFKLSLERGLPVYAGVDHPDCGHAVVIDGYEKDNATGEVQFRVNPGHGQGDTGYFTITTFPNCRFLSSGVSFMTPEYHMYVYPGWSNGDGGPISPFNNVSDGINAIPAPDADNPYGGRLVLHGDSYSSFSFSKPMEVSNYLGDVTINGKVTIRNWGVIRRGSGGTITIN